MKKIILAVAVLFALPVIATAAEEATAKEEQHQMHNSNPAPAEKAAVPEHQMHNSTPTPAKH